jgi:DNA-binding XRE family transcriptional regulator
VADWQRLGDAVSARRSELGETRAAIAHAAGISPTTLYQLEKARQAGFDDRTLLAVERVLGWRPGSVQRVLEGGSAVLQRDPDFTAIEQVWEKLAPGHRRMLRLLATEAAKGTFS